MTVAVIACVPHPWPALERNLLRASASIPAKSSIHSVESEQAQRPTHQPYSSWRLYVLDFHQELCAQDSIKCVASECIDSSNDESFQRLHHNDAHAKSHSCAQQPAEHTVHVEGADQQHHDGGQGYQAAQHKGHQGGPVRQSGRCKR